MVVINVNALLECFDEFVDDIVSSDVDLLNGELDFLIIQTLFQSIDLETIKDLELKQNESKAA